MMTMEQRCTAISEDPRLSVSTLQTFSVMLLYPVFLFDLWEVQIKLYLIAQTFLKLVLIYSEGHYIT